MIILFTLNLILLHIILINLRRQTTTIDKIQEFERRQEQLFEMLRSNAQCSFDIVVEVFDKYGA